MAVTAKFVSDFTDFNKGVKSAEISLQDLYGSVQKVAGIFGVAVGAGAVVAFGKSLVDAAGHLVDLSQKTGNSIEQLQRWTAVGKEAGVAIDDFTTGAYKLGIALAEGDKSAVKAVEQLGLNFQKLRTMNPDEQFNTVIAALEKMTDVQDRNRVGQELFGKSWATIAPAIAAGYTDIAKAAKVSTDEQVRAIDAASDAFDAWVQKQKTGITSWIGDRIIASEQFSRLTKEEAIALAELGMAGGDTQAKLLEMARARAKQVDINLPAQRETVRLTKAEQEAAEKLAETLAKSAYKQAAELRAYYNMTGEREIELIAQQMAAQAKADEARHRTEAELRAYYNWVGERQMEDAAKAEEAAARKIAAEEAFGQALMDAAIKEEKARFALQGVKDAAEKVPPAAKPAADSVLQLGAAASQAADNFFSMSGELYNAIRAAQQWDDLAQKDRNIYGSTIGGIGGSSASTRWGQASVAVTINGSVLSNKDEIARVVGDAVTSSYRTGGNRLPV